MLAWKFIRFMYFQDDFQLNCKVQTKGSSMLPSIVPSDVTMVTTINPTHLLVATPGASALIQSLPSRTQVWPEGDPV